MLFMKMKPTDGAGPGGGENDVKGLLTAEGKKGVLWGEKVLQGRKKFSGEKSRARQEGGEDQE